MIDLEDEYLAQVLDLLNRHVPDCEVRAFGTRVTGGAKRYSDLDLAIVGAERLDWRRIEALKDAFAESGIPIMVDVLDWNAVSDGFRAVIGRACEVIRRPA
ncbi:MAG: nucleotidyltransferase domain-containing protein [Nitrospirae bacterium]|nr:nucleotidyltransferase domain-containing protein [Nitrospirota bacterium]